MLITSNTQRPPIRGKQVAFGSQSKSDLAAALEALQQHFQAKGLASQVEVKVYPLADYLKNDLVYQTGIQFPKLFDAQAYEASFQKGIIRVSTEDRYNVPHAIAEIAKSKRPGAYELSELPPQRAVKMLKDYFKKSGIPVQLKYIEGETDEGHPSKYISASTRSPSRQPTVTDALLLHPEISPLSPAPGSGINQYYYRGHEIHESASPFKLNPRQGTFYDLNGVTIILTPKPSALDQLPKVSLFPNRPWPPKQH